MRAVILPEFVDDAQLRHLLRVIALPSVSLGVIPTSTPRRRMWAHEAFTIFDDTRVQVELLSASVTVVAPNEVVLYTRAFEGLAKLAVYGTQARALIKDAISALE